MYLLPMIFAMVILFYICVFRFEEAINIVQYILFLFIMMYAIIVSDCRTILSNRIAKFLSSISLEIYLCHMVIFRVVEKLHLTRIFSNAMLSFALVSVLVFAGSVGCSVMFQKIYSFIRNNCMKGGKI